MLNISELMTDPDFAQRFVIERSVGQFALGGWQQTTTTITAYGLVTLATDEDLDLVPEGDRITGSMTFYSVQPLWASHGGPTPGTSDVLQWNGQRYRVAKLYPYQAFGFYKAVGVRLGGN